ncbi:hypothetical protein [Aquella oligotrophica]|uniref:Uncharacterized protein n=1 Tax=Aquella oligotrophica TaxID=2067065 RepID=A0A2I7N512_9NEIS|nr:hypothetical protein [Aquella oligotrophica]AUR51553.1 hypothetical protein CUN60_04365 [Aquella oligotrophica]
MKDFVWNNSQINTLLGAAKFIASVGDKYDLSERNIQCLQLSSYFLLSTEIDINEIPFANPIELAATLQDSEQKKAALEFLVLAMHYVEDYLDEKRILVEGYLRSLKLSDLLLKQLSQTFNQYQQLIEYNEFRKALKSTVGRTSSNDSDDRFMLNENSPGLSDKYQKLTLLAKNSLGYNLYKSYRKNKFPLPGERLLSNDKIVLIYDIVKLIAGYRYDIRGDLFTLAFIAGNLMSGSFIVAAIGIIEYYYQNPNAIKKVNKLERKKYWNAIRVGMNCSLDFTDNWEYEANFIKSLNDLRAECNLV